MKIVPLTPKVPPIYLHQWIRTRLSDISDPNTNTTSEKKTALLSASCVRRQLFFLFHVASSQKVTEKTRIEVIATRFLELPRDGILMVTSIGPRNETLAVRWLASTGLQEGTYRHESPDMPRVVYSRHYNIGFFGLERLHPFDSRKYGRAWRCLKHNFGDSLYSMWIRPKRPIRRDELLSVHESSYLDRLRRSEYVAGALEVPPVRYLPHWLLDLCVLRPMRWATMGTIVAAQECIQHGIAVNLSGGYHHAKPADGEGFCIYSDIALAVHSLRRDGLLTEDDRVAYIDLDAHQGNGVCHTFMDDKRVFIFDMYNCTIYPSYDSEARDRIDCDVRITSTCHEQEYLRELKDRLPEFLDSVSQSQVGLAIYNAGTDVYVDDPLGLLNVSADGILQRDLFVVRELRKRGIPTVMLLSGGYTRISYKLVADSVIRLLKLEPDGT